MLYAYDYHDSKVKAVTPEGSVRWQFGRWGKGPGEIVNGMDIEIAPDGSIWLNDDGAGRLTIVTPDGSLQRHVQLEGDPVTHIVPNATEVIGTTVSKKHFWAAYDTAGRVTARGGFPVPELGDVEPAVRQVHSATARDGKTWAATFPYGDLLIVYRGRTPVCAGRLVEGAGFSKPEVRPPRAWVTGVAMTDSSVYILPLRRRGEDSVLDEYSAADCRYRQTLRLPGRQYRRVAISDSTFFFEHEAPAPTLLGLRLADVP
jgi:hypothetical protein